MKSSLTFPCVKRVSRGFTLIEILVAIAVLGLLVVTLGAIFSMTDATYLNGVRKINNFTKARALLNILQVDFQSAIFRPDLPAFPSTGGDAPPTIEFYSARAGVPSSETATVRNVSLVKYAMATGTLNGHPTSTLERYDMPVEWTDPGSVIGFGNTFQFPTGAALTPRDTAPGVVAFGVLFIQADGSFSSTTFTPAISSSGATNPSPTHGIGITLAVIDDRAMQVLTSDQISTLSTALASAIPANPTQSVKASWEQYLKTGLPWNTYPKVLGNGIEIYECYVSIP
jgi:prepilin-type N-terminal cleavage/methylation domain-containing protein